MKLSQIVALEADSKQRNSAAITEIHKASQKGALYEGHTKSYECTREGEEQLPPEKLKVRMVATDALKEMAGLWAEWLDLTASKDYGNAEPGARADVVVNGEVLIKQAPVPFLLWMEKQLTDWRKAIDVIPTLDEAEDWVYDDAIGMHRTKEPVKTHKTKKVQEGLVLHPPTKEHPAQTQLISRDIVVGYWSGMKFSGALTVTQKKQLLERVNAVLDAVKVAREDANNHQVSKQNIGQKVFDFLLGNN